MNLEFNNKRKIKRTRKLHRCSWCDELIPVGDPSVYHSGVYDGDFYADHMHVECDVAKESITEKEWREWDYTYIPGSFKRGTKEEL
jgi:hypothetical protein